MESQGGGAGRSGRVDVDVLKDLRTLTVEQTADVLGVRPEAVRIWIREGALRAMKWGRRHHIRPEALREFQAAREVVAPDPAEFARRAARGKAAARPGRAARRGGPLAAPSRPRPSPAQPGEGPRPSPDRHGGRAPSESPAAAVRQDP